MYRIGLSSCGFELNEQSFEGLAQSQIQNIEIAMPYEKHFDFNYKATKKFADKYGINLWSYHLPFSTPMNLDIAALNEDIRLKSVEFLSEVIKKAADIGIDKFVIHPSSEPKSEDCIIRDEEIKKSMDSLNILAELAYRQGAVIAVEDLPRSCLGHTSDEIIRLISANEKLRVCFDVNHLLQDTNINFIKKLSDKIITVHISDYDFINERHWLPGEGKINWQELYQQLCSCNYNGVWLYEIRLKCPPTILRSRDLTFMDFRKNANEIFTNTPLTVIGKQKDNLGMWE